MAKGNRRQNNRYKSTKNAKTGPKPTEEEPDEPVEKKRISTGFPTLDGYTSDGETETAVHVKKKKSGGFQSMGLSRNVFLGILRKGYKVPTPIQRKCIPVILEGKDVVAMARTGSGKTAAFLVPMLEHLTTKPSQSPGCRALILSPTRELAIQTLKFTKELGKLCSLKAELILGGDSLEEQFAALHTFPDIIIATPGRLLHVMVEMNMKLNYVEYLVFDEADRLFEMGFAEQLNEILRRVPEHRQTLLFSATLPKSLVEFAQAGLHDPELMRLDVDNKISQDLKMAYFYARSGEKNAVLLHLLRNVVRPDELTVIFVATKHHIEYLREILDSFDISCTHIFSALDPSARKINIAKFASKKTHILLVTDVAARGIDIPMLDNVINYNFPGKPKLFVHRVGRVARAGRTGTAYSIIGPDEVPYLLDLHLFLGRPLKMAKSHYKKGEDSVLGRVPQEILDEEEEELRYHHEHSCDLVSLRKVVNNAMKLYLKSRPLPSTASMKRSKEINMDLLQHHPQFESGGLANQQISLADEIKKYKPHSTIFEINATKTKTSNTVMRKKREKHSHFIEKSRKRAEERDQEVEKLPAIPVDKTLAQEVFFDVTDKKVSDLVFEYDRRGKQLPSSSYRDEEFYIPHVPSGDQTEKGLGINSFEQQASQDVLNLTHDEREAMHRDQHKMKWDRKKKRFIGSGGKEPTKKLKTESGNYIPASYSKQLYEKWLKKSKEEGVNFRQLAEEFDPQEEEGVDEEGGHQKGIRSSGFQSQFRHRKGVKKEGEGGGGEVAVTNEVLTNEAILKNRKQKAVRRAKFNMKRGKKMRKRTKDKYGAKKPLIYTGMNSFWKNQKGRQPSVRGRRGRGKGKD